MARLGFGMNLANRFQYSLSILESTDSGPSLEIELSLANLLAVFRKLDL